MASLPASPRQPLAPSRDWLSLLHGPSAAPLHQEHDELMEFWASSIEPPETDPLQFWHGTLVSRPESRLVWMAIDYLSAPASSVDIECAFSHGAFMVTHRCHALSDQSTHNSIVISAWLKDTKLIPKEELIEFFQKKTARERLEAIDSTPADVDMSVDSDMSM